MGMVSALPVSCAFLSNVNQKCWNTRAGRRCDARLTGASALLCGRYDTSPSNASRAGPLVDWESEAHEAKQQALAALVQARSVSRGYGTYAGNVCAGAETHGSNAGRSTVPTQARAARRRADSRWALTASTSSCRFFPDRACTRFCLYTLPYAISKGGKIRASAFMCVWLGVGLESWFSSSEQARDDTPAHVIVLLFCKLDSDGSFPKGNPSYQSKLACLVTWLRSVSHLCQI